ncbi:thermonuclease family protein [Methylobacterium sp. A54F]
MPRPALACLILAGLALAAPARAAEALAGPATVIDGDTIEVRGTRIRLYGIDAPEAAQTCESASGRRYRCGRLAAHALAEHIGAAPVTCEVQEPEARTDAKGAGKPRAVAICRLGTEDLAAWLVGHGHALANRRTTQAYARHESKAWATRRGLWAGTFEEPADWRRARQHAEAEASPGE